MKRIFALLITMLLLVTSCAKEPEPMPVIEKFDNPLQNVFTNIDYFGYQNEAEMFEGCDLVFVGTPVETFTESELHYYAPDGSEYVHGVSERIAVHYTHRKIKVLEVLKGEPEGDIVTIGANAYVEFDGDKKYYRNSTYPTIEPDRKNAKYLYYVSKSITGLYIVCWDSGRMNVDGLDKEHYFDIDKFALQIRERHSEIFEKYDRTKEVK